MVVHPLNRHKLLFSACIIFTISALLTILFMIWLPFSFIILPLIICAACLLIFSAYGAYLLFRSFNFSRDQRLDETTPLFERKENLELGLSPDFTGVTTEDSGRKRSSPRPTPKVRVAYEHPTPMPQESYLTDIFMSRLKGLGDFIRSRRHTVSESDAMHLDNLNTDHLQSVRVYTMSDSEVESQTKQFNQSVEGLFQIELVDGVQYKGCKSC